MGLANRLLGALARELVTEGRAALEDARRAPGGRDALGAGVLLAGTVHVAAARSGDDALDRLERVVDVARRVRGDR